MDNKYSFDLKVKRTGERLEITQDVSSHLDWAKDQREISKQSRLDRGFKPYCNIPDSVSLDIMTKYGINIHGDCNKDDLRKVKQIIKQDYPALMYY
jgi:hypothetical protein